MKVAGSVAQLVELRFEVPRVSGSNPLRPTKNNATIAQLVERRLETPKVAMSKSLVAPYFAIDHGKDSTS